jgi:tetratricopeptide (TPR) repeat protein
MEANQRIMQHIRRCFSWIWGNLGTGSPQYADGYSGTGDALSGLGQLDEAENVLKQALTGHEKVLEPGHLGTLRVVHILIILYYGRGKPDEAEAMRKRAHAGYEKALGLDHPDTLANV